MDKINELLTRGVENIIPGREVLEKVLRSGKKLNIYLGIDPTATRIHIGHAVTLRKIQAFMELGHNVTFLVGDFTALIGDTSDKDSERPILTKEEIAVNFATYKSQAEKILDFSKVTLRHNSEWLSSLTFEDIVRLCQNFTVGDFISRELIRKRLDSGSKVRLDEMLYPIMQGFDSYFMDTDLQVGGTDQTFNMQAGRTLQKNLRSKESFVLATGFLMGTDGRKMSKSWGNAVWIADEPSEMFGKLMSINDELIEQYFLLATNVVMEKIELIRNRLLAGENPMVLKKELAWQIVFELHSKEEADKSKDQFENTFQKGNLESAEAIEQKPSKSLIDSLVSSGIAESKSEAKRLLEQKAVEKDGITIETDEPTSQGIYKIGKKKFLKIV